MDNRARARNTRAVAALGRSRRRLAEVLNAAFAEGLISEHTHAYRLDLLLGPWLVDPQRLIGDLTLGRKRSRLAGAARDAWSAVVERLGGLGGRVGYGSPPLLLALDRADCDTLLIGRHPACDVVVGHLTVSRRHAQLTFRDGVWVLQDLASKNGTAVNGVRVGRTTVHAGDVVWLGGQPIQID
jgi:FHA domain